jgi:hypothetical protein
MWKTKKVKTSWAGKDGSIVVHAVYRGGKFQRGDRRTSPHRFHSAVSCTFDTTVETKTVHKETVDEYNELEQAGRRGDVKSGKQAYTIPQ